MNHYYILTDNEDNSKQLYFHHSEVIAQCGKLASASVDIFIETGRFLRTLVLSDGNLSEV